MSTARDAGMAALQSGDIQTAITQLEAAAQEDPTDFDVCLYLGGAYGQAGRPLDAIKSVTQAVQLQPANAQARYNLGVAMEQGGYNEQALQVYSQALHLQPDYPNAQQAVDRLHASSNQGFGAPARGGASASGSGQQFQQEPAKPAVQPTQQFAQPAAFGQQQPVQQPTQQYAQPAAFGQQQPAAFNPLAQTEPEQPTSYNPLAPPQQSAQPTQAFAPPAQQSPAFGRPSIPVGQPQQPAEAGLGSYMAPPPPAARAPDGYGAPAARPGAYSSAPSYDDEFKLGQAFKDFFRALFSPGSLFTEMEGCGTSKSAWALFTLYAVFMLISSAIAGAMKMSSPAGGSIGDSMVSGLESIGYVLITWVIFAGIVHLLSRAFGSSLTYGGSVRCVVYSAAPFVASMFVITIVAGMIAPQLRGAFANAGATSTSTYSSTGGGSGAKRTAGKSGRAGKPGASGMNSSANGGRFGTSQPGFPSSSGGSTFGSSSSPYSAGSMPSGPNATNPFGAILGFVAIICGILAIGALWGIILLGVAVSHVHEVSSGAAAGVAILGAIIGAGIFVGVWFVMFAAKFSAAMGSMPH